MSAAPWRHRRIAELEHERGRLAGMADRHAGRSYAEQGEDVNNAAWHRGYAIGWRNFDPAERPTSRLRIFHSQAEANATAERVGWLTIHPATEEQS